MASSRLGVKSEWHFALDIENHIGYRRAALQPHRATGPREAVGRLPHPPTASTAATSEARGRRLVRQGTASEAGPSRCLARQRKPTRPDARFPRLPIIPKGEDALAARRNWADGGAALSAAAGRRALRALPSFRAGHGQGRAPARGGTGPGPSQLPSAPSPAHRRPRGPCVPPGVTVRVRRRMQSFGQ